MKYIAIFASGTGTNAANIIQYFREHAQIKVQLVVSNKPEAGVVNVARGFHLPVLIIEKEKFFRDDNYVPELKDWKIDFIVLAGFLWKVPAGLIAGYRGRIINIHPALLPAYGGKGLYAWIRNPAAYMAKDEYTQALKPQYNNQVMPGFPNLSNADIDAIAEYLIKASAAPAPTPGGEQGNNPGTTPQESDNALLYGILTLILAIIALILLQVNSNLKKLADDKEGVPSYEPVPFYRNKAYISLLTIVLFIIGGYYTIQGAIDLGRTKDYQPVQPIYYSHKVHVGKNQISCLYCHSSALEGKQANIPSVNQCMNCHIAVNEYTGSALYDEEGKEINGNAEIQKLYKYAGWDPNARKYVNTGKEVEWVRIHNLPDHVYFNHSQHVNAGKVQCQTCHGPIQEMDEVYQFSDLSMGWCVNCHRETKVQFTSNKFYSIYEKFHEDLKRNPSDSITVSKIGGTECQKCHY